MKMLNTSIRMALAFFLFGCATPNQDRKPASATSNSMEIRKRILQFDSKSIYGRYNLVNRYCLSSPIYSRSIYGSDVNNSSKGESQPQTPNDTLKDLNLTLLKNGNFKLVGKNTHDEVFTNKGQFVVSEIGPTEFLKKNEFGVIADNGYQHSIVLNLINVESNMPSPSRTTETVEIDLLKSTPNELVVHQNAQASSMGKVVLSEGISSCDYGKLGWDLVTVFRKVGH